MARRKYKFTEKTHSVRALGAMGLAFLSLTVFGVTLARSVELQGNGSQYLGAAGLFSMLASAASFYFAVKAVREEDTFRILPAVGMAAAVLSCGVWIAVYVMGFTLG